MAEDAAKPGAERREPETGGGSPGGDGADAAWMRRCLELARRGEGRTSPNPMVGSAIVSPEGILLAEGYHRRAGAPHAEAEALEAAGAKARGATLYVNLEPCRHTSQRRTTPCVPKIEAAGVARVVYGIPDPVGAHGGGAALLAERGIDVCGGVLANECAELNRAFVTWARHGRPYVTLKAAITLDGRIATRAGASQWITGESARRHAHGLRDRVDAVAVGAGTVAADDPRLTVRMAEGRDPARIVVDARLDTPPDARVLPAQSESPARAVIAAGASAPAEREARLRAAGAEVWRLPERAGRVDLGALAARLGREEMTRVLVEGGAELHAGLVGAGVADEVLLYLAPIAFGGDAARSGPGWLGGAGTDALAGATRFAFAGAPERLGEDLLIRLVPRQR